MMTKRLKRVCHLLIPALLVTLISNACVKYDALPFEGKVLPRRSGYVNDVTNDWIYYNLRTGQIFNEDRVNSDIKEGEQKNRLDWDVAFCGYAMRTNSGSSGSGAGGAADLGRTPYAQWQSVSQLPNDLKWVVDNDSVYITMAKREWVSYAAKHFITDVPWFDPNRGPKRVRTDANPLLAQAMTFSGPPPSYTPSYHIYLIRCADGKTIFKFQLVSWYNNATKIGDSGGRMSFYCDRLR